MYNRHMKKRFMRFGKNIQSPIVGAGKIFRKWQYITLLAVFFIVFGTILSLLNTGTSEISLLFAGIPFTDVMNVLFNAFIRIFTNPTVLILAIIQAIIFSMLIFVWRTPKLKICRKGDAETVGIGAILTVFGVGCPSCGISLITPIFASILSTGASVAAEIFGTITLILAFIISFLTFIYIGKDIRNVE